MGGLWGDNDLMSTIPGLFVTGEANFSDHGANRLGASALMQGLADGYFVIPYTLGNYIASNKFEKVDTSHEAFKASREQVATQLNKLLGIKGKRTVDEIHKELGNIMWNLVGMSRTEAGLKEAIDKIRALRADFWKNVNVAGEPNFKNSELEKAGRVADFLELGELMATDALERKESCGGHFREEYQTPEAEAQRDDANFSNATAWEYTGGENDPAWKAFIEPLTFEYVKPSQRSYK
jgi:succinate dehydrogenase / fumarate reductase flavoprotein subunit